MVGVAAVSFLSRRLAAARFDLPGVRHHLDAKLFIPERKDRRRAKSAVFVYVPGTQQAAHGRPELKRYLLTLPPYIYRERSVRSFTM